MALHRTGWLILLLFFIAPPGRVMAQDHSAEKDIVRARTAVEQKEWKNAIGILDKVIKADSDLLEARYLRGVCYGELGKYPTLASLVFSYVRKGETDLNFVLARDSLYRDVLFQQALLKRYIEDYPEAIRLGHEQIRLTPNVAHVQVGLFRIYWRYIIESDWRKAMEWLRAQQSDHSYLFTAELFLRQGWISRADELLEELSERETSLSRSALLLARARVHYAWNKPSSAQQYLQQAIQAIETETDALFVFDDVKYIVSPEEIQTFNDIDEAAEYQAFFETFWERRNPLPASEINERIVEHYRRFRRAEEDFIFYGYRAWYNNPGTFRDQDFPSTYALGGDFDDRGIIYLRHGEPDYQIIGARGGQFDNSLRGSWRYDNPNMIFSFSETSGGGTGVGRMRLVPLNGADLQEWGTRRIGMDWVEAEQLSYAAMSYGLTTDHHSWPDYIEMMEIPFTVAAFRGEDAQTLVEVYYTLPLDKLARGRTEIVDHLEVEMGLAVQDSEWRRVKVRREVQRLPAQSDQPVSDVACLRLDVPPDRYHFAFHGRSLQKRMIGSYSFDLDVPSFNGSALSMSDLLLADTITRSDLPGPLAKGNLHISVNPLGRFNVQQPISVYFEIYNLRLAADGSTRYRVTYTLESNDERGTIFQRRNDATLSLMAEDIVGATDSPVEYVEIDMSTVPPGSYVLTVTVQDDRTGAEIARSRTLELTRR